MLRGLLGLAIYRLVTAGRINLCFDTVKDAISGFYLEAVTQPPDLQIDLSPQTTVRPSVSDLSDDVE